jgi:hypothetical protein
LIKRKLGANSDVVEAMENLQGKPESVGRRETLAEEVKASKASEEPELLSAAKSLLDLIKALPNGEQHVAQVAHGTGIAQASGGSTATVNIHNAGRKNDA